MHSMAHSATSVAPGGVQSRIRARAAGLTTSARRLTAERGLAGFTIEELCESAGISRRTFFNYFSSKEEAVLGLPTRLDEGSIIERFLDNPRRASGPDWTVLVDDLAELTVDRWDVLNLSRASVVDLIAALRREPRLITGMHEINHHRERADIELVERREGLTAGHPVATSAVLVVGVLARASAEEFLREDNTDDFRTILARRIAATREAFSPSAPLTGTTQA